MFSHEEDVNQLFMEVKKLLIPHRSSSILHWRLSMMITSHSLLENPDHTNIIGEEISPPDLETGSVGVGFGPTFQLNSNSIT